MVRYTHLVSDIDSLQLSVWWVGPNITGIKCLTIHDIMQGMYKCFYMIILVTILWLENYGT